MRCLLIGRSFLLRNLQLTGAALCNNTTTEAKHLPGQQQPAIIATVFVVYRRVSDLFGNAPVKDALETPVFVHGQPKVSAKLRSNQPHNYHPTDVRKESYARAFLKA
ncbi:hypothetical protein ElyMa_000348400 [Elysia marginata]|uniref:Secreted protein n=1 Tax=Elysia marginata TaxID=1093978 RepID=A0AAV4FFP0_9GAST|nr:hypothetical protein ElyMa_000348400 [Elysia marginata]